MSSPFNLDLSDNNLAHIFDKKSVLKAKEYQERGMVHFTTQNIDNTSIAITATVQGNQTEPYQVTLSLTKSKKTDKFELRGSCSCPVQGSCKHLIACLIEFRKGSNDMTEKAKITPHPIEQTSPHLSEEPAWKNWVMRQNNTPVQEMQKVLFNFFLKREKIECSLSRVLKNGSWAKSKNLPYNLSLSKIEASDLELLSHLIGSYLAHSSSPYTHTEFSFNELKSFSVMEALIATKRCFIEGDTTHPLWQGERRTLSFSWHLHEAQSYKLKAQVSGAEDAFILNFKEPWYINIHTYECGALESIYTRKQIQDLQQLPCVPIKDFPEFAKAFKQVPLPEIVEPEIIENKTYIKQNCTPMLILKGVAGRGNSYYDSPITYPVIEMYFKYENIEIPLFNTEKQIHRLINDHYIIVERDIEKERAYLTTLLKTGHIQLSHSSAFHYRLSLRNHFAFEFADEEKVISHLKALRKEGWVIKLETTFPCLWVDEASSFFANLDDASSKPGWFDLDLGVIVEDEKVSLAPILQKLLKDRFNSIQDIEALDNNRQFILTTATGKHIGLKGERFKQILRTLFELYDEKTNSFKASSFQAVSLSDIGHDVVWKKPAELKELSSHLASYSNPKQVPLPASFNASLRPYQQFGLNWLQYLREGGFGGVLADDMGLGKTVQTLAHLLIEKKEGRMTERSIIVAPTSLMSNWKNEAEKFTPELKVLVLHGNQRKEDFAHINDYDLIITTYPLLVRDEEFLLNQSFYYLILDEAQFVKNAKTKGYAVLSKLKAKHKLCLTGTPMENNLGDLWSLFNFINEGLLGSHKQFTTVFRGPIEKGGHPFQQTRLAKRIAPFLLRRKKDEVAIDLPPKTEIIRKIVLEGDQRDLYETIRSAMHDKIKQTVKQKGFSKSHIIILDALLKLRQVCCDPRLVKLEAAKSVNESAKFNYLISFIEELLGEGRKILLFSSFTSMLELIENQLNAKQIAYTKLTGETKNRAEAIQLFQQKKVCLFLISLKAGGTGLNLTEADTVIHYDPWWNPAAENQATDRAHRMGQTKPVFVYKLIAEGSIEEKILTLQQKKQELIQNLFAEEGNAKFTLSPDEIDNLFEPIESLAIEPS